MLVRRWGDIYLDVDESGSLRCTVWCTVLFTTHVDFPHIRIAELCIGGGYGASPNHSNGLKK